MKSKQLRVSTLIIILLLSFIGIVFAFWTSGVLVNDDFDDSRIDVGLAKGVESTISISSSDASNLVPIGTLDYAPDGSVEFVIIPINLLWTEENTNFASGLRGLFTISPTIVLKHNVENANTALFHEAYNLLNVYFVTSESVTENDISTALTAKTGTSESAFWHALFLLDHQLATNAFEVELTIEVLRTIYLVAFIGMPDHDTLPYLKQAVITVDLMITAKPGQNLPAPIIPTELVRFKTVSVCNDYSVAIDDHGKLWSWGRNYFGNLGNDTFNPSSGVNNYVITPTPIPVTPLMTGVSFALVSASTNHVVALDDEGYLWTWGNNSNGQLGNGSSGSRVTTPTKLSTTTTFKQVSAGDSFSVAICYDNTLWSWGANDHFQQANGNNNNVLTPTQIDVIKDREFKAVDAGLYHIIAIDFNDSLWGWGFASNGQVGTGSSPSDIETPTQLYGIEGIRFAKICIPNTSLSMALDIDGQIWTWGGNNMYQLGTGNTTYRNSPTRITNKETVVFLDLGSGVYGGTAIDNKGRLWSWGSNGMGSLGQPNTTTSITTPQLVYPTPAIPPAYFVSVTTGYYHVILTDINGRSWVTGLNNYGQLGIGLNDEDQLVNSFGYVMLDIKRILD